MNAISGPQSAPAAADPIAPASGTTQAAFASILDATDPVPITPPDPRKTLKISFGTAEDLFVDALYQYGAEVGAPRLEYQLPMTHAQLADVKVAVAAYVDKLRREPEGNPVLGPDEKLYIEVMAHGQPLGVSLRGIYSGDVVNLYDFAFLADYAHTLDFASCSVAADYYQSDDDRTPAEFLQDEINPFMLKGTELRLNSTIGMLAWGVNAPDARYPMRTPAEKQAALMDMGVNPDVASALSQEGGVRSVVAERDLLGAGGNGYRFVPVDQDKNGGGDYQFEYKDGEIIKRNHADFKMIRHHRNGDCYSTEMKNKHKSTGVEYLYSIYGGGDSEEYHNLKDGGIVMPEHAPLNGADYTSADIHYYRLVLRFDQHLHEGVRYGDPRALDLALSFARLKHDDPEGYAFLRDEVLQATAEDGYFAWVERLAEKIPTMTDPITEARLLMPEGTGLGLRNVQNPTSY